MSKQVFNFATPLHLVTSNDELRPAMQCVWFLNGNAYASDSHVFVRQSLDLSTVMEIENLNGHQLHRSAFKDILKYQSATATDQGVECVGKNGDKAFFPYHVIEDKMPDFEAVLSDIYNKDCEPVSVIGFSSLNIARVGKAMGAGSSGLRFVFRGPFQGVTLKCNDFEMSQQVGLIMPIGLGEEA
jgi:hypothetical protein